VEIKEENNKKKEENNKKEINNKELKENKKEVSFKNIKENKDELKQINEKEKEKEITKSHKDFFANMNSNKKRNVIDTNKPQKLLSMKNFNFKETESKTIESKPNNKNKKIKEKKAIIKKFLGVENRKDMNNNLTSRNKQKKPKYNFDDIPPLDEYKLYLDALFNEKTSNIENFITTMNNYNKGSPLNKNSPNKSKNNINHNYNYTVDNNITDSNIFDVSSNKKSKRNKNKKNNKDKYTNNFLNTLPNTNSLPMTDRISPNSQINLKKNKLKSNRSSGKNKKNYLTIESMSINENENEFEEEINNKFRNQKKNHQRMKSCDDEENTYNKKQLMEIRNTLNKEFYHEQIKSINNNSISARKIRIISKEKLSANRSGKNNGLTINTMPKYKNNNIINQIYVNDKLKNKINSFNINLENAKNKLKDKLISVTNELKAEKLELYTGPINIGCITSKNIDESLNKFINKMKMNGYKYVKIKDYLFKCSKGDISFNVELVKIKGNLLYFLVKMNNNYFY
jgi:hypothetical protein